MVRASVQDVTSLRFPPPKGVEIPVGTPAYLRSSQVLYDPGFEGFVRSTYGWLVTDRQSPTGSHTYPIPFYDATCAQGVRWPDGTCSERYSSWYQRNGSYTVTDDIGDLAWKVTNSEPRSGAWCAAWWDWTAEPAFLHPPLIAVQGWNFPAGISARCSSGDTITWSTYGKVSSTTGTPQITPWLTFYTEGLSVITNTTSTTSLTTSYANYPMVTGAPSGSYYVRAMIDFVGTGASRTQTRLDDFVLGVQ